MMSKAEKARALVGKDDRLMDLAVYALCTLALLMTAYPLAYVCGASVSSPESIAMGEVLLLPKGFTLEGYREILRYEPIWVGYRNTFFYTVVGTMLNLLVTLPCAYALSRPEMLGRAAIMMMFTFTMFFSGGTIPTYLAMQQFGMINSVWSVVFPGLVSVYNMIISRTYFMHSIPRDIQEAAMIDGCRNTRLFLRIVLPLSMPIVAVIMLYYAVAHWNAYFNALIYLSDANKFPLQLYLRNILLEDLSMDLANADSSAAQDIIRRMQLKSVMKYGIVIVSSVPVLVLYPLIQRYFAKGVMIGAIKG